MDFQNQKLNTFFLQNTHSSLLKTCLHTGFISLFFIFLGLPSNASEIRIVSLNPSLTEMLFDLGLEKNIVGTTSFSNFPKEASLIPTIGSYFKPSIEKIIRLKPTHVLAFKEGDPTIYEELKKAGLNFYVFESRSLEDFESTLNKISNLFNSQKAQKKILEMWKSQWSLLSSFPKSNKKILIQVDHNPIFIAGGDTFLSKSLEKCGLKNIFENINGYKKVQPESIFNRRPDIILVLGQLNSLDQFENVKKFWNKNPITVKSSVIRGEQDDLSRLSKRLPSAVIKACEEIRKL